MSEHLETQLGTYQEWGYRLTVQAILGFNDPGKFTVVMFYMSRR